MFKLFFLFHLFIISFCDKKLIHCKCKILNPLFLHSRLQKIQADFGMLTSRQQRKKFLEKLILRQVDDTKKQVRLLEYDEKMVINILIKRFSFLNIVSFYFLNWTFFVSSKFSFLYSILKTSWFHRFLCFDAYMRPLM